MRNKPASNRCINMHACIYKCMRRHFLDQRASNVCVHVYAYACACVYLVVLIVCECECTQQLHACDQAIRIEQIYMLRSWTERWNNSDYTTNEYACRHCESRGRTDEENDNAVSDALEKGQHKSTTGLEVSLRVYTAPKRVSILAHRVFWIFISLNK